MWIVDNPTRTFATLNGANEDPSSHFVAHVLLKKSKWESLLLDMDSEESDLQSLVSPQFQISDVQVDDPNIERQKLACKLIRVIIV
jgi:hypothetical protein